MRLNAVNRAEHQVIYLMFGQNNWEMLPNVSLKISLWEKNIHKDMKLHIYAILMYITLQMFGVSNILFVYIFIQQECNLEYNTKY